MKRKKVRKINRKCQKKKSGFYRYCRHILIFLLLLIVVFLGARGYRVWEFNQKPIMVAHATEKGDVYVESEGASGDTWTMDFSKGDAPNEKVTYTGATCNMVVENKKAFDIIDWTMRLNIKDECYLNGFWNGGFEIHQFRDGGEIVDTIPNGKLKPRDMPPISLDRLHPSEELMIHLMPGDFLVYHPSVVQKETIVKAGESVGVGANFYYLDSLDLSDISLEYRNDMHFQDGEHVLVLMIVVAVWLLLFSSFAASRATYLRTKHIVEALSHSVISGLSREYKTIWLVHIGERTIQLIRNLEDNSEKGELISEKKDEDYDIAMKAYVDQFVVEKDRERVWNLVKLDRIIERFQEVDFFTVNYLHQESETEAGYFQMAFTRALQTRAEDKIVLVFRDVNDIVCEEQEKHRQLEDALQAAEAANRTKSMFLANMSHEIRTPINAILGMDTMILRESGEENVKQYAKDIRVAGNTLLTLINDILDFSKIESGRMEIVPVNYRLDSVINDLNNMVRSKAEEKGLTLNMVLNPETPVKLFGDEIRVKQIILNILNNAVKYTKTGSIDWEMDFEKKDEKTCLLKVSVRDTGIGIRAEDLEKIYSPYKRVDEKQNRSIEGTGLGLSITKNLLERMGSVLKVESVYGEGSVFSFELEQEIWGDGVIGSHLVLVYDDEEKEETFHAPEANILVVDDVDVNLVVIRNLLKRVKINPDTCLSGAEAVDILKNKKYDIVFLDAMMPVMSGEETLEQIRKQADINRETPVIVLTANAIIGAREEYMAKGFSDYLSKPVSGEALERMIEKYLPKEKMVAVETPSASDGVPSASDGVPSASDGVPSSMTDNAAKSVDKPSPQEACLTAIRAIEEIEAAQGIAASGGKETYLHVCENFCETAADRIGMIQSYFAEDDIENYTIQVHALKSTARLVGAMSLSELALEMEMAGKEQNKALINEKTQEVLQKYEQTAQRLRLALSASDKNLSDAADGDHSDTSDQNLSDAAAAAGRLGGAGSSSATPRKELTEKKLRRNLEDLMELLEAYDYETARDLFSSLSEYQFPDDFAGTYAKCRTCMADVNADAAAAAIRNYLEGKKA